MNDTAFILTLAAAVGAAVPIALAALGELLAERSGVLNLGVEGMMLIGAVMAFQVGDASGSLWLALLVGSLAGALFSSIHAFLTITLRANQIVSGLALVIFGTGLSTFIGKSIEGKPLATDFTPIEWGPLADIPVLGPMLFDQDPMVYATIAIAVVIAAYLNRTKAGLAVRAVGESPGTADTMGVAVVATRYVHVDVGWPAGGHGGRLSGARPGAVVEPGRHNRRDRLDRARPRRVRLVAPLAGVARSVPVRLRPARQLLATG